jgi:hypothetical protein
MAFFLYNVRVGAAAFPDTDSVCRGLDLTAILKDILAEIAGPGALGRRFRSWHEHAAVSFGLSWSAGHYLLAGRNLLAGHKFIWLKGNIQRI